MSAATWLETFRLMGLTAWHRWFKITTRIYVKRKAWTEYDSRCPPGSGYCKEHHDRQYLRKEWMLWSKCIFYRTLDTEDVPLFVAIQQATIGYSEWQSKFAQQIKDQSDG